SCSSSEGPSAMGFARSCRFSCGRGMGLVCSPGITLLRDDLYMCGSMYSHHWNALAREEGVGADRMHCRLSRGGWRGCGNSHPLGAGLLTRLRLVSRLSRGRMAASRWLRARPTPHMGSSFFLA